jgi:hypothetical protein
MVRRVSGARGEKWRELKFSLAVGAFLCFFLNGFTQAANNLSGGLIADTTGSPQTPWLPERKGFKTMCKKLGVTGLVIVAALVSLWKLGWLPYIHQEAATLQQSMKDAVPPEKDLAVLEREVKDLAPEINKQSAVVAKNSVELDKMTRALTLSSANLKEREEHLAQVRAAVKNEEVFVTSNGQKISKDKLEAYFAQKFFDYRSIKDVHEAQAGTIETKKQQLAVEEQKLQAMRTKLSEFKNKLELQKIELAKVRATQIQNGSTVDDSQFARVEQMFEDVETKIATQRKQQEMTTGADTDKAIQSTLEAKAKAKKALEAWDSREESNTKVASDKK